MAKKKACKIGNNTFHVGEIVHIDGLYVRIKEIVMDWDNDPSLNVEAVYTDDGKPCETEQFMSLFNYTRIERATPVLRRRINKLLDEEERLQQILSQCQKGV